MDVEATDTILISRIASAVTNGTTSYGLPAEPDRGVLTARTEIRSPTWRCNPERASG